MLLKLTNWFHELFKSNTEEKKTDMLNLVLPFVANMLRDVVADKAQSLAVEHLEPHLEKLPKEVKEALDGAVDGDNSHGHKSSLTLSKDDWLAMHISPNFTLKELIYSPDASWANISQQPTLLAVARMTVLVVKVLQPIRDHFGLPLEDQLLLPLKSLE